MAPTAAAAAMAAALSELGMGGLISGTHGLACLPAAMRATPMDQPPPASSHPADVLLVHVEAEAEVEAEGEDAAAFLEGDVDAHAEPGGPLEVVLPEEEAEEAYAREAFEEEEVCAVEFAVFDSSAVEEVAFGGLS